MTAMVRRAIFLLLVLASCLGQLRGSSVATAAEVNPANDPTVLLAMMKAATGGTNWDRLKSRHIVWRMSAGGLSGVADQWDELGTGRSYGTYKLGLLSGGQGFDGNVLWTQDESGQSRAESSRDASEAAISAAYRTSMGQWFPDRHAGKVEYVRDETQGGSLYYVLRVSPEGGRQFDLLVSRKTNLVQQLAEREAAGDRVETYSDYRDVGSVRVPFAVLISRGDARYDQLFAIDRIEFDVPLDAVKFAQPGRPPADYTFPAEQASVDVPLRILNGHIYLLVKLNGRGPYLMLFDSGGANVLQPEVVKNLALSVEGALSSAGIGEQKHDIGVTKVDRLEVGGIELRNQVFSIIDLQDFATRVEGVDAFSGLVGYELFKRFPVKINYERGVATFYNPETFKYTGNGVRVPFRFTDHTPEVDGSIDGIPGVFAIDTGSRASVDLGGPFVEKNDLTARYAATTHVVSAAGAGGRAYALLARPGTLTLGDVTIAKPMAYLSQQKSGSSDEPTVAGNVGYGVLRQFNLTFDYARQQIFFEKNASFGRPDVVDRSGLWVERTPQGYEIIDVVDGGPADQTGLTAGDIIKAIDGKPIQAWSLADARTRLSAPSGTRVRLTIGGAKSRQVDVVLRDLI